MQRAEASGSTQLHVGRGEKVLAAFGGPRPLHTASVTKVLVGVTVARSVALARLGLDDPICRWVPSWSSDGRSRITLRHLLGHASSLDASTWTSVASGSVDDLLAHVVEELPLVHEPGTHVAYNNLAAMLVPAVLARSAGRDFLDVFRVEVAEPLGFGAWEWNRDPAGNPFGMSAAQVSASDLAAVGRLLAQDGRWGSQQLLPRGWVAAARRPVTGSGRLGLGMMTHTGPAGVVYGHDGSGGQHLWVGPRSGVVVTRLHDLPWAHGAAAADEGFRDLPDLVVDLDRALSDPGRP